MLAVARVAARAGKPFSSGAGILLMQGRRNNRRTDHDPPAHAWGRGLAIPYHCAHALTDS
jgi:hypothetical protein